MIKKFKIIHLFDVSAFGYHLFSLYVNDSRSCQAGSICPSLGRVTADDALMSGVIQLLLSDSLYRCVLIFKMHLFRGVFAREMRWSLVWGGSLVNPMYNTISHLYNFLFQLDSDAFCGLCQRFKHFKTSIYLILSTGKANGGDKLDDY